MPYIAVLNYQKYSNASNNNTLCYKTIEHIDSMIGSDRGDFFHVLNAYAEMVAKGIISRELESASVSFMT